MKQGSIVLPLYLVSGGQIQCRLTSDESIQSTLLLKAFKVSNATQMFTL